MKSTVLGTVIALFFLAASLLFAQESGIGVPEDQTDVFAPFVSRLRVAIREPQVRLTWQDAGEIEGAYRVYRNEEEIDERTFADAQLLATVEAGSETYLDTPPGPGEYYYAVLTESEEGEPFRIFIPFRNKTIEPAVLTETSAGEDLAARVFNLTARVVGNGIELTYDASRNGRELAVYRSTVPIRGFESLEAATRIAVLESIQRRYVDYPVPGVPYYYAVFDTAEVDAQELTLASGENLLADPAEVRINPARPTVEFPPRASRRGTPLPLLQLATGSITSASAELSRIPSPRSLDPPTREALDRILVSVGEPEMPRLEPVILPTERVADARGTRATLTEIIQDEFARGAYDTASQLLSNLLSITLEEELAARARFYLGQSQYFSGEYRNAFLSFLLAEEAYHSEVTPWMDAILTLLTEE
ncbi:MAG: hypothetical protein ACOC45_03885 [Alkalispirochaetaceae bacterium]